MNEPRRFREAAGEGAAAMLLRSARRDAAPRGGKKRAMAMLGLEEAPYTAPMWTLERSQERRADVTTRLARRTNARIEPTPALFQHILGAGDPSFGRFAKGRWGATLLATSQAALVIIVLLLQPTRADDPPLSPLGIAIDLRPPPSRTLTSADRISGRDPVYTPQALEAGVEGMATVECRLDAAGQAHDCQLIQGLPYMDAELLAAAKTWRFSPAQSDGKPVRVTLRLVLRK